MLLGCDSSDHEEEDHRPTDGEKAGDTNHPEAMGVCTYGKKEGEGIPPIGAQGR